IIKIKSYKKRQHKMRPVIKCKLMEFYKEFRSYSCFMYLRSFLACKFGFCVVAHTPNAQIFLRLRRGPFYVDALVLPDTFSCNNHYTQGSAFSPSWRLQLGNIGDTDFHYAIMRYHLL